MKEAYKSKSADKARKKLRALWLERNGYDAGSVCEARCPSPSQISETNSILNGTMQSIEKRQALEESYDSPTALGVVTAEKKFRRIKGYRHMGALVQALRSKQKSLDSELHNREGLFHPFAKASGSFVVAVSLEPRHQCLKSPARLVGTLAFVRWCFRHQVLLRRVRMLMSAGLPVSANAINKDVGVHTKVSLNVRHHVVSPARIAERTASLETRLKL